MEICTRGVLQEKIVKGVWVTKFRSAHNNCCDFCISVGVYIINLKKTWEKLLLAARAIVAIENPADVCVISSRNTGQVNDKLCDWFMLAAFVLYPMI